MSLTPEEKERIAEEEKARIRARDAEKAKQGCIGCLVIVGIAVVIALCSSLFGGTKEQQKEAAAPTSIDLNASVRFTGTQFVIANKDEFAWYGVKMEINYGAFSSGYIFETPVMLAGTVYTVGAMQFAKPDGTRFNPWQVKVQEFMIYAKNDKDEDGFWFGSF